MFLCGRAPSPVPQAPQLTKLLQQKSVFQVQHTASPPKSQKSARPLRRRLSADEVLVRSNRSGRFKRRHSIKPPVQTKKRPIFILTDTEIQKNRCLSEPLGDLSLFVSRVGVPRQTTAPVRPAWMTDQDQHSNLFTPTFPGPYQVIEQSFFYPQSNESTSPQSVSSCQYNSSASFDFDPNNEQWLDGSLIREQIRYESPPQNIQTWPNTPESDLSSNDDLSSIEPSFSFDNYSPTLENYDLQDLFTTCTV